MILQVDENIRLELTDPKHASALIEVVDANREHLSEFLPWVPFMKTVDDMTSYTNNCVALYQQEKEVSFVIFLNDRVVGRIGLHHMNMPNRSAAIGYWLAKEATGTGVMRKSCVAIIDFGFTEVGLNRIEIKAATQNVKSQAIPEKLGFIKEGVLRQAEWVGTRPLDIVLYAMLQSEWAQR